MKSKRVPVIGVTTTQGDDANKRPYVKLPQAYVRAVLAAGGSPLLVPAGLQGGQLEAVFDVIDGLLLSGGGDIAPSAFGADGDSHAQYVDEARDALEFSLLLKAIEAGKPFLGICRGLQVINVTLGGSLFTDIPSQRPGGVVHRQEKSALPGAIAHKVSVEPESRLAGILGNDDLSVNSRHHQCIKELASGLKASAFAPDGVIEAVELEEHPFGVAVQWHPENLIADERNLNLFRAFVRASAES